MLLVQKVQKKGPPPTSLSHQILTHIYGAGDEDDKSFNDVLHIGVDTEEGQSDEDDTEKYDAHNNSADLTDTADE